MAPVDPSHRGADIGDELQPPGVVLLDQLHFGRLVGEAEQLVRCLLEGHPRMTGQSCRGVLDLQDEALSPEAAQLADGPRDPRIPGIQRPGLRKA